MNAGRNTPSRDKPSTPESLYQSAVLLCDPAGVPRKRGWKRRAERLLLASIEAAPRMSEAHALLAYVQYLDADYSGAEASIRRAVRCAAGNGVYLRLLIDILLVQEKIGAAARWLQKLAAINEFDLANLKSELRASQMPTDARTVALNAFPNALGWFESQLSDDAERLRRGCGDVSTEDSEFARDLNRYRLERLDARRVPAHLRSLIPMALEWGIADDAIRDTLLERASQAQKTRLRKALSATVRRQINGWLDSFTDEYVLSDEAARFMYLLLAYEEIRG